MTITHVVDGKLTHNNKELFTYVYDVIDEVYNPNTDEYTERWGYKFHPFNGQGIVSDNGQMLIVSISQCFKVA